VLHDNVDSAFESTLDSSIASYRQYDAIR